MTVDVRVARHYEAFGNVVESFKIVRGEIHAVGPVETEPAHVLLDRPNEFVLLGARVRVVKAQVAVRARQRRRNAEVEADALRVTYVEIAVRFRREPRHDGAAVLGSGNVPLDHLENEIGEFFGFALQVRFRHGNLARAILLCLPPMRPRS